MKITKNISRWPMKIIHKYKTTPKQVAIKKNLICKRISERMLKASAKLGKKYESRKTGNRIAVRSKISIILARFLCATNLRTQL